MAAAKAERKASEPEEEPSVLVKVAVPPGTGLIAISLAGAEPFRYREAEGIVEVPEAELEIFLSHVSGSSVIEPAIPAEKEN